eukprot:1667254-Pyramimonas_sp.AAC.1
MTSGFLVRMNILSTCIVPAVFFLLTSSERGRSWMEEAPRNSCCSRAPADGEGRGRKEWGGQRTRWGRGEGGG